MRYLQVFFPMTLTVGLVALVVHARRRGKRSLRVAVVSGAFAFLLSWPPIACVGSAILESGYESRPPDGSTAGAIVVLSGTVHEPTPERPYALLGENTYVRCRHAAWLHRDWKALPVLVCGGANETESAHARAMRVALAGFGVPGESIWTEERSRSTYENAVFAAELLEKRGIDRVVLVTEAYHMPRAARVFRARGLEVIPAACGFRATTSIDLGWLLPGATAIRHNEQTLHEIVGMVLYALSGRM